MKAEQVGAENPRAKKRREQVLAAAADCFRREGFHATSMSKISATARMSSGHIYHYFGSKEDIVVAIVQREHSDLALLLDEVEASAQWQEPVAAVVDRVGESAERYTDRGRASLMMEILAEASRSPRIAETLQQSDAQLRERFYDLLGDASPGVKTRCEMIAALLEGLAARVVRNPDLHAVLDQDMLQRVVHYVLTLPDGAGQL